MATFLTRPRSQSGDERRTQERRKRSKPDGAEGSVTDDGMKTRSENGRSGTRAWRRRPQQEDVNWRGRGPFKNSSGKTFEDLDDYLRGRSASVAVKNRRAKRKRKKFGGDGGDRGGEVGSGSWGSVRGHSLVSDRGSSERASGGNKVSSVETETERKMNTRKVCLLTENVVSMDRPRSNKERQINSLLPRCALVLLSRLYTVERRDLGVPLR